jgi:hypothetical protein
VQRTGDARALQRLGGPELFAQRHQAGHFGFGNRNLAAAEIGEADVGNGVIMGHDGVPALDGVALSPRRSRLSEQA